MEQLNLRHLIVSFTSFLFWFVSFLFELDAQTVIKHTGKLQKTLGCCNLGHNFNHYKDRASI